MGIAQRIARRIAQRPASRLTGRGGGGGPPSDTPFDIDYFGEEISFVGTGDSGQYADGSYWVRGTLTGMTPTFATGTTRTTANLTEYANTEVHGWMVNPGEAARYKSGDMSTLALRQAANYGVGAGITNQAYDSLVIGTNHAYDAANKQALPSSDTGSVVKAKSRLTNINNQGRPTLDYKAVLTIVSTAPASGSIRPPIARANKTPVLNTSQLDLTKLRNLDASSLTGIISYTNALNSLSGTHTWQHSRNVNARNILPLNGLGLDPYFGTTAELWAQTMLAMHSDAFTTEQKTTLAIQIGKIACDIAAAVYEGRIFTANGGHSIGRLPILAFAAELFDSAYLRDACSVIVAPTISNEAAPGQSVYGDLTQLYYATQTMIDGSVGELYPIPQEALGWPHWGSQYGINPANNVSGNLLGVANSGTDNTGITNAASYISITGKSYTPASLALRLLLDSSPNVPTLYHDWADRYGEYEINDLYVLSDVASVQPGNNAMTAWVKLAYEAWKGLVSTWSPAVNLVPATVANFSEPAAWAVVAGTAVTGGELVANGTNAANATVQNQSDYFTPITAGETYVLSFTITSFTTGGNLRFDLQLMNGPTTSDTIIETIRVGGTSVAISSTGLVGGTAGFQFTAPATATHVRLRIQLQTANMQFAMDDITVQLVA